MKKILVFTDWYEPGFKAGGPIRSAINFAFHMKGTYEVFVFTSDRDLGDLAPYKDIKTDQWLIKDDHLQLFYATPEFLKWGNLVAMIRIIKPDFIYLNSMFSKYFSLYPLMMKRFGNINAEIVLAPRGMLRDSALAFKSLKKKLFLSVFNLLRMPAFIRFHATDSTEASDIRLHFGSNTRIQQSGNFPGAQHPFLPVAEKQVGGIKMIFVGRIHPVKNLAFLLDCLADVQVKVELTIVAAIEDQQYWKICSDKITKFAPHINVEMLSEVPHEALEKILLRHHLFVLPTKGENFGHAIYEALAAGRPVLVSDQTPWRNLQSRMAGWDLPLSNREAFQQVIKEVAAMDIDELNRYCLHAWQFCHDFVNGSDIKKDYLKLFS
jgi:glycosyltransferase involved in cell wall biosynthesis